MGHPMRRLKRGPNGRAASDHFALTKEYDALVANGSTWDIVPVTRPEGTNVIVIEVGTTGNV